MAGRRTWAIRVGTLAGFALLAGALYAFVIVKTWPCTPGEACDPPTPKHLHLQLALVLAASGVATLIGTLVLASVWRPHE